MQIICALFVYFLSKRNKLIKNRVFVKKNMLTAQNNNITDYIYTHIANFDHIELYNR